jgi:hypothetical protein
LNARIVQSPVSYGLGSKSGNLVNRKPY